MLVLGISPSASSSSSWTALLRADDGKARVFETGDGASRLFCMPFNATHTFWQLSFATTESEARALRHSPSELRAVALSRCGHWHTPIPELIRASDDRGITGYPAYDRDPDVGPSRCKSMSQKSAVTLIGDARQPLSPFKGQGANQALLDAVALAEVLTSERASCDTSQGKSAGALGYSVGDRGRPRGRRGRGEEREGAQQGIGQGQLGGKGIPWGGGGGVGVDEMCRRLRVFEAAAWARARPKVHECVCMYGADTWSEVCVCVYVSV
jgi:hypothetical protein